MYELTIYQKMKDDWVQMDLGTGFIIKDFSLKDKTKLLDVVDCFIAIYELEGTIDAQFTNLEDGETVWSYEKTI